MVQFVRRHILNTSVSLHHFNTLGCLYVISQRDMTLSHRIEVFAFVFRGVKN